MKKVLIVEDTERLHRQWREELGNEIELISAYSIGEAERLFAANPDITAIVMDACVPGSTPNTQPLVRKIRETFTGPIIATSGAAFYREGLLQAGCSHEASKNDVPKMVCEVLGLSS